MPAKDVPERHITLGVKLLIMIGFLMCAHCFTVRYPAGAHGALHVAFVVPSDA